MQFKRVVTIRDCIIELRKNKELVSPMIKRYSGSCSPGIGSTWG